MRAHDVGDRLLALRRVGDVEANAADIQAGRCVSQFGAVLGIAHPCVHGVTGARSADRDELSEAAPASSDEDDHRAMMEGTLSAANHQSPGQSRAIRPPSRGEMDYVILPISRGTLDSHAFVG